jgi:hypothetical protein
MIARATRKYDPDLAWYEDEAVIRTCGQLEYPSGAYRLRSDPGPLSSRRPSIVPGADGYDDLMIHGEGTRP